MRLLLFIFAVAWSAPAVAKDFDNPWLDRDLSTADLLPSVEMGADYLLRNQLADGQFVYIKDPLGQCCRRGEHYSLIRHLGAVYALLRSYELTQAEEYLEGAKRGMSFANAFRDKDGVVRGFKNKISLGENGFFLIDAVLYARLSGKTELDQLSADLARFIADNLDYNGRYATHGQWAECQAIIGLMLYYRYKDADERFVTVARKWLDHFKVDAKHTHWSTQAIQALVDAVPTTAAEFTPVAIEGGHAILENVLIDGPVSDRRRVGARGGKLLSCNATARSEGLVACHLLARRAGNVDEAHYFLERVKEHIAFAMQFQFGGADTLFDSDVDITRVAKLFGLKGGLANDASQTFVRIDYVAHHIRAIANYLNSGSAPIPLGVTTDELSH